MKSVAVKIIVTVLCIVSVFAATGCWNKQEPKDLAVVHSVIYDIDENGQIVMIAELMNPQGKSGEDRGSATQLETKLVVEGKGDSAREALVDISKSVENFVFGGHNTVRFFSERFAKTEMVNVLDFFARSRVADETSAMVVIKGETPYDIYFSKSGFSNMVGEFFEDLVETQKEHTSKAVYVTTLDFFKDYLTAGKQPVAGLVKTVEEKKGKSESNQKEDGTQGMGGVGQQEGEQQSGDQKQEEKIIVYEGLAAFKDGKLCGFLDGEEARAYNILVNEIGNTFISIRAGDGRTVLKIEQSQANIKAAQEGDSVKFFVNIEMITNIIEQSSALDITREESVLFVQDCFNQVMRQQISDAIYKIQHELKSDIVGFGRQLHTQFPDKWRELKNNWNDYFTSVDISVAVQSTVTRSGQIKKPFKMGTER